MLTPKLGESQVDYGIGHRDSHCGKPFAANTGYCKHFIEPLSSASELGQCQKVAGSINRVYWCRPVLRLDNQASSGRCMSFEPWLYSTCP
jgi:hypothetical protein